MVELKTLIMEKTMTEEMLIRLTGEETQKICLGIFKKEEGKSMIMETIFSELSEEMDETIGFYSIEAGQAQNLKQQYSIQIIPSFLIFENGKLVEMYSGLISKSDLQTYIRRSAY